MNDQATEETKAPAVPRGPNPENQARLDYIVKRTKEDPGITSPTIAKELNITTLNCSQLADRLVKKGTIQLRKIEGGVRTYYPEGFDMSSLPPIEPKPSKEKKAKAEPTGEGEAPPSAGEAPVDNEDDGTEEDDGAEEDDGL